MSVTLSQGGIRSAALEDLRGSPLTRRRALEEELQRLTEDRTRFRSQTEKEHDRELRIRKELDKFAAMRDPMKRYVPVWRASHLRRNALERKLLTRWFLVEKEQVRPATPQQCSGTGIVVDIEQRVGSFAQRKRTSASVV